jgi:hypothetical protein
VDRKDLDVAECGTWGRLRNEDEACTSWGTQK